jgi:hypothetical protein
MGFDTAEQRERGQKFFTKMFAVSAPVPGMSRRLSVPSLSFSQHATWTTRKSCVYWWFIELYRNKTGKVRRLFFPFYVLLKIISECRIQDCGCTGHVLYSVGVVLVVSCVTTQSWLTIHWPLLYSLCRGHVEDTASSCSSVVAGMCLLTHCLAVWQSLLVPLFWLSTIMSQYCNLQ